MNKKRLLPGRSFWFRMGCFFLLAVIIEVFLFNWSAFLTRGNVPEDYTTRLSYSNEISGNEDGSLHINGDSATLELLDINQPVNLIRIDIEVVADEYGTSREVIELQLSATDEGNAYYTSYPERTVLHRLSKSQFIHLNTAGDVGQIRIKLNGVNGCDIAVHSVIVNPVRPFLISPERILFLVCLFFLIWQLRPSSELWKYMFNPRSRLQKGIVVLLAAAEIAFTVFIFNAVSYAPISDSPYTKMADAIIAGSPYIADEPSEELKALENPYDPSQRIAGEVDFLWDYAYYNGHYYVYFGVIPALLMHVPYKLLTGQPLINGMDILIPGILCVIGLICLVWQLCRRYFSRIPFALLFLFAALAVHASRALYLCAHPDFYSIPKLCALTFTVWGIALWLAAIRPEGKGLRCLPLALGSLCMATVAGCRPQMLMGSFLAIPLFGPYLLPTAANRSRKGYLSSLLCFFLPFVIMAAGLMYYNYIRFGTAFDFGANYNLTTNDMTKRGLNMGRIPAGIFAYFFQYPENITTFPFLIHANRVATTFQGVNIIDETYGGLLAGSLFLWASLLSLRKEGPVKEGGLRAFCGISIGSAFIVAAADTMMAGVLESYINDFAIFLVLPAIIVLMAVYQLFHDSKHQKTVLFILTLLCVQGLVFNLCHLFASSSVQSNSPLIFYKLYYFIQFWL